MRPRIISSYSLVSSLQTTTLLSGASSAMTPRVSAILRGDSKSTTGKGPERISRRIFFFFPFFSGRKP